MDEVDKKLQITKIQLKKFRCFDDIVIDLDKRVLLIQGDNGSGKTSLLEALHYVCYLRSFRTHLSRDLIKFGENSFFIKVWFNETIAQLESTNSIQVGCSGSKRLVRLNKKAISSYKELMKQYRIVSITEDDLDLISGSPQVRRAFIDQSIILSNPDFIETLKKFRIVLDNRNTLLQQKNHNKEMYFILTEQLWKQTRLIQEERKKILLIFLDNIYKTVNDYFNKNLIINFNYECKNIVEKDDFEVFFMNHNKKYQEEVYYGRSLFGAHLDDFIISFNDKKSKSFASRGQKKLIVSLVKIAQINYLSQTQGAVLVLLDDFMTDFDLNRAKIVFTILSELKNQLIFTSPALKGTFEQFICSQGGYIINLAN